MPSAIAGGQGLAYGSDDLVVKPADDPDLHEWLVHVLADLPNHREVRVIRPVRARDGSWVVDGWAAWERLAGSPDPVRWRDSLAAADALHELFAPIPWSPVLRRDHAWGRADRFAWGEEELSVEVRSPLGDLLDGLLANRRPVDLPNQLVHGDLGGGNVLFEARLPPAVIDISPYWRPRRYAEAILLCDAVAWAGADLAALEALADEQGHQLALRAVVFRLVSCAIAFPEDPARVAAEAEGYQPVVAGLDLLAHG